MLTKKSSSNFVFEQL